MKEQNSVTKAFASAAPKQAREAVLYLVFGVMTTLVNLAVYQLTLGAGFAYASANAIAFIAAIVFAYVTNKRIVFESRSGNVSELTSEFIKFVSARIGTFLIEMLGLWIFIDWMGFDELIPKYLMTVIVIVLNYFLSKWIVFNKSE